MTENYSTPTNELVKAISISELLPQKDPFIMIGSLRHFDMEVTKTETIIKEDNILVDNGKFSSTGLLENIAQTCAARIGYINKYINKKGIQIGLIGAVRNFDVSELPNVGDTIETCITVREEVFGMILAEAVVECNGKIIAQTEIKIAVTEEEVN